MTHLLHSIKRGLNLQIKNDALISKLYRFSLAGQKFVPQDKPLARETREQMEQKV